MSITATITSQWSDGKRLHVIGTLAFTGNYATGGVTLDLGVQAQKAPLMVQVLDYRGYNFVFVPSTLANNGKLKTYGAGNVAAYSTITSDNTEVSDGDTVTVGGKTYRFKNTMAAINDVKRTGTVDDTLLNLAQAINGSGVEGTDYFAGTTANANVSADETITSHSFVVTALVSGTAGNSIATTTTAAHLSWTSTVLQNGANSTPTGTELSAAAYPTDLQSFSVPFYAIFDQLM